jgi:hypothetical protein
MERDSPRPARRTLRVPPFYPVPTRTRRDGWTMQRQADFLGMLAETGSVMGACEAVGMSRKSAYALRAREDAESFAAAWDAALGAPVRKVTVTDRYFLAHHGLIRLVLYRGRYRGAWHKPDDSALLGLCGRLDRHTFDDGRDRAGR